MKLRVKYPPIEPYRTHFLQIEGHRIYFEESGNANGVPVVFLHGGPGSGTEAGHRCFFNPMLYRIVLVDQRGCGKSTPHSTLEKNTTWHLVEDLERIRIQLGIERWVVFGGSWGSTLALAYAELHPDRVLALIVRGIFLASKKEFRWFFESGANHLFPDEWEKFLAPIPSTDRAHLLQAYYERLTSSDASIRRKAALAWSSWEAATLKLHFDPAIFQQFIGELHADALARVECHYFLHDCFFEKDDWLLEHAHCLHSIPGVIIHGRYDVICPLDSAWRLHRVWPQAKLEIIADAGHAASEPGITDALIRATDFFGESLFSEKR